MMPTPEHVQLLGLAVGTPVLAFTRTGFSPDRPVRVSVTIFAGHLNRVVYTLGDPAVIARHREER